MRWAWLLLVLVLLFGCEKPEKTDYSTFLDPQMPSSAVNKGLNLHPFGIEFFTSYYDGVRVDQANNINGLLVFGILDDPNTIYVVKTRVLMEKYPEGWDYKGLVSARLQEREKLYYLVVEKGNATYTRSDEDLKWIWGVGDLEGLTARDSKMVTIGKDYWILHGENDIVV